MNGRKRMKREGEPGAVRFLTFSCYKRLPLLGSDALRGVFAGALADTQSQHRMPILAWVVMPEHVHLLLVEPRQPVSGETDDPPIPPVTRFLASLKQAVSQRVLVRWKQLDAPVLTHIETSTGTAWFWQPGGGFDRRCRTIAEVGREICYIHDNPVNRGLVPVADDWAWSSLAWWRSGGEVCPFGVACSWPPGKRDWRAWRGYVQAFSRH